MKRQSFQKKRRPTNSGLFVFHTRTKRRKKQRVAASADLGSEVPNLGVARALFVILVLHVAAIAAIFIHNRVTDDDAVAAGQEKAPVAASRAATMQEDLPRPRTGEPYYFVTTGDTYDRIARLKGVDVNELRDLNNNVKLKAGRILRLPAGASSAVEVPVASASLPDPAPEPEPSNVVDLAPAPPVALPAEPELVRPVIDTPREPVASAESEPAQENPPIVVRRSEPARALRVEVERTPMRVAPRVHPPQESLARTNTPPPAATPRVPAETPAARTETTPASTVSYTVRSGDTAWGIARRHKISVDGLLKANGIADARKLRIGMNLRIPAN